MVGGGGRDKKGVLAEKRNGGKNEREGGDDDNKGGDESTEDVEYKIGEPNKMKSVFLDMSLSMYYKGISKSTKFK